MKNRHRRCRREKSFGCLFVSVSILFGDLNGSDVFPLSLFNSWLADEKSLPPATSFLPNHAHQMKQTIDISCLSFVWKVDSSANVKIRPKLSEWLIEAVACSPLLGASVKLKAELKMLHVLSSGSPISLNVFDEKEESSEQRHFLSPLSMCELSDIIALTLIRCFNILDELIICNKFSVRTVSRATFVRKKKNHSEARIEGKLAEWEMWCARTHMIKLCSDFTAVWSVYARNASAAFSNFKMLPPSLLLVLLVSGSILFLSFFISSSILIRNS